MAVSRRQTEIQHLRAQTYLTGVGLVATTALSVASLVISINVDQAQKRSMTRFNCIGIVLTYGQNRNLSKSVLNMLPRDCRMDEETKKTIEGIVESSSQEKLKQLDEFRRSITS